MTVRYVIDGGVMLVFDGPIASSSVSLDTFYVELDDGSEAEVVDVLC